MPFTRIIKAAQMRRIPWKNGLGTTEEIVVWPRIGGNLEPPFLWRISRAAVNQDGPFSIFPGVERTIVVLKGAGMELHHGDNAPLATVLPLRPYTFSGQWMTDAKLIAGPVTDFNVMVDRQNARARVEVQILNPGQPLPSAQADHVLVHVLQGVLRASEIADAAAMDVTADDSICFEESTTEASVSRFYATERTTILLTEIHVFGC